VSRWLRSPARAALLGTVVLLAGCSAEERCGPSKGVVDQVMDGDTIVLRSGEKVRYLMVDSPETSGTAECYGKEAREFNRQLVLEREVTLRYDEVCTDRFGRLLAYVTVDGSEVNSVLVQRGFACALHIPPNGDDRLEEFQGYQDAARSEGRGLWGFCSPRPC
jgi:micrococcal nuclease